MSKFILSYYFSDRLRDNFSAGLRVCPGENVTECLMFYKVDLKIVEFIFWNSLNVKNLHLFLLGLADLFEAASTIFTLVILSPRTMLSTTFMSASLTLPKTV